MRRYLVIDELSRPVESSLEFLGDYLDYIPLVLPMKLEEELCETSKQIKRI
jgi:hypothetical protein